MKDKELKNKTFQFNGKSYFLQFIGVTGFEPATSRPPAVRSNQAEPYPVVAILYHKTYNKAMKKNVNHLT